jgi:hypothetical protein
LIAALGLAPPSLIGRINSMTWTPDKVEALAKDCLEAVDIEARSGGSATTKDTLKQSASALTWALEERAEALEGKANFANDVVVLRRIMKTLEAERDAANARAESVRLNTLKELETVFNSMSGNDWNGTWSAAMMIAVTKIRALKEAGK